MREIKFKYYFQHDDTGINVSKILTLNEIGNCKLSEISMELGRRYGNHFAKVQYTGLKDKNGIEIYEGDIVKCTYRNGYYQGVIEWNDYLKRECIRIDTNKSKYVLGMQEWKNGEIKIKKLFDLLNYDFEVIGNIYENGDLL